MQPRSRLGARAAPPASRGSARPSSGPLPTPQPKAPEITRQREWTRRGPARRPSPAGQRPASNGSGSYPSRDIAAAGSAVDLHRLTVGTDDHDLAGPVGLGERRIDLP